MTRHDFSHRKDIVERRILALGGLFSVGIYAYAVMSNHVHVVLTVQPDQANQWSTDEVVERWLRLFPSRKEKRMKERRAAMLADPARISECRERLSSLSWFMRCLNEYLAKRFNLEDECTGRFWEGRFSCQALLNQKALLAAMAYVDLNPIRAEIAKNIAGSKHTGVRVRHKAIRKDRTMAEQTLKPLAGYLAPSFPKISESEYIALVDWTGRQWHPTKRGKISRTEPSALRRLGLDPTHWTHKVKGVGSAYWRVIGTVEEMLQKAVELKQAWVKGINFARWLEQQLG